MAHPFEKLFDTALKRSTTHDNQVLAEANKLLAKGYQGKEISQVLKKLSKSLIDETEAEIVAEAYVEYAQYLED